MKHPVSSRPLGGAVSSLREARGSSQWLRQSAMPGLNAQHVQPWWWDGLGWLAFAQRHPRVSPLSKGTKQGNFTSCQSRQTKSVKAALGLMSGASDAKLGRLAGSEICRKQRASTDASRRSSRCRPAAGVMVELEIGIMDVHTNVQQLTSINKSVQAATTQQWCNREWYWTEVGNKVQQGTQRVSDCMHTQTHTRAHTHTYC